MKIVIIQESGRHEKNKNFRESLNLKRSLNKIENINVEVWGLGYDLNNFEEIESWSDVILIVENYNWKEYSG